MTPRERILRSIEGKPVDHIPVDCSGHRSSGISAITYNKLRKHLDLPERPVRVYDPIQQLAILDEDILSRFGIDTIELGRAFYQEDKDWCDWTLPDGSPCQMPAFAMPERDETYNRWLMRADSGRIIAELPDGALFFEQAYFPWAECEPDYGNIEDEISIAMSESMWCAVPTPSGAHAAKLAGKSLHNEQARQLRQDTDRAILGLFGGNLLEIGQFLYRNEIFFMLLASEPNKAHRFLDALTDIHLRNLEKYLADFGDVIDIIVFGDDLGMQNGPQISTDMYREFFKPRHARMWHHAKELADVKVMLHCCGGVDPLLEDLIDAGLDAINPVQITCRDMDLPHLKQAYGKRLCFWGGGCDTRQILPDGSPDEVRRHVREQLSVFGTEGGFVFQQVHNLLPNIPSENIVAMFDEVQAFTSKTGAHT
jgi:uroporphyrinogen decarboxylase